MLNNTTTKPLNQNKMKVKLIKEDNEYYLEDSLGDTIYSTDKILLKETDTVKRLSLKN